MAVFATLDYLVLGTVLLISASIGVHYRFSGGKQKTNQEYLMGNRNQGIIPVAFSVMASFMSAITLLGTSAETYSNGLVLITINIAHSIAVPIITNIFIPVFFNLGEISVYSYLERRFGVATRLACSLVFILQIVLYMGVTLYAPALALEAVSGLSHTSSILIIGFVCMFYSSIGGMKAVIMTDVFQSILMYGALFCVIGVTFIHADGLSDIWRVAEQSGRLNLWNFSLDPTERHSVVAIVIGGVIIFISLFGVNQIQVQRYLTVKNLEGAKTSLWVALPLLNFLSMSACFCGMCLLYRYHDCDPVKQKRISSNDQLMPLFVLDTMSRFPGLPGLFVAGIFSAALSTISGAINSLAAVTLEDYLKPTYLYLTSNSMEHSKSNLLSKLLAIGYGGLCIGLAFFAQYLGRLLQASLTIFAVVGGPLLAVFSLGMLVPRCNQKGALVGLFMGLMFSTWLGFGGPKPPVIPLPTSIDGCPKEEITEWFKASEIVGQSNDTSDYNYFFRISYMYYAVLGFCTTIFFGLLVSSLTEKNKNLDPVLYTPFIAKRMQKKNSSSILREADQPEIYMEPMTTNI